ncbi:hypothetical protein PF008_g32449 [Phytophthora fragariae]|uniref:Uncharacterized protein n=1 Tax=Phytophthora fragariae TaxID=53985 RepID=A0A6G0Q0C3_9STRA|nr:hypothetical protein PF008_g32449 [Phytophthora fragariae]
MSQVARSPQGEIEVWIQDQECWNGSDPSQPKRIGGVELREEMTAPWIEERRIADGELQSGNELGPRMLQGRIRPPPPRHYPRWGEIRTQETLPSREACPIRCALRRVEPDRPLDLRDRALTRPRRRGSRLPPEELESPGHQALGQSPRRMTVRGREKAIDCAKEELERIQIRHV